MSVLVNVGVAGKAVAPQISAETLQKPGSVMSRPLAD